MSQPKRTIKKENGKPRNKKQGRMRKPKIRVEDTEVNYEKLRKGAKTAEMLTKGQIGGGLYVADARAAAGQVKATLSFSGSVSQDQLVGTNVLNIPGELSADSLLTGVLAYASQLFFTNVIGSAQDTTDDVNVWDAVFSGLAYMLQSIRSISTGATVEIDKLPRFFDVLSQMLTEKTVRLESGIVRYSPQWDGPAELPQSYTLPCGSVYVLVQPELSTNGFYSYNTNAIVPSKDGYSAVLKMAGGNLRFGDQIVQYGEKKGLFTNDPSCYARCYSYFGSGGAESFGLYNEVELEAPFLYPMFARFVKYDTQDKVISRIFHPTAGALPNAYYLSTRTKSNYSLLRNPIPPIYKFLDFYQLCNTVLAWITALDQEAARSGANLFPPITFTFGQKDFMVLLRQALLTQFPSQVAAQFVSPQAISPSQNNSVFQPFVMDSLTTPTQVFSTMELPEFVVENLNMLKARCTDIHSTQGSKKAGTTPKKLEHNFIPVWGVYSGDVPVVYQYIDGDGNPHDLFAPDNFFDVDIVDGRVIGSTNVKADLNFRPVSTFLSEWNAAIQSIKNRSTPIAPISSDKGPGVSLLMYTRILETIPPTLKGQAPPKWDPYAAPFYENIVNKPRSAERDVKEKEKPLERTKSSTDKKKPVKTVPPATYFDLYCQSLTSHRLISNDFNAALRFLLLPSIRLDPATGQDPITRAAYAVYTGEVCSTSNSLGGPSADNEAARAYITGSLLNAGAFAANATNDDLTQAVNVLVKEGKASDLIKSLLGGMASLIPGVGGVISNVIQGL